MLLLLTNARVVFWSSAVVIGFVYWWYADWWAYVEFPEGRMLKFTMPWWWPATVSGGVGAAGGGVVVLARSAAVWTWTRGGR